MDPPNNMARVPTMQQYHNAKPSVPKKKTTFTWKAVQKTGRLHNKLGKNNNSNDIHFKGFKNSSILIQRK